MYFIRIVYINVFEIRPKNYFHTCMGKINLKQANFDFEHFYFYNKNVGFSSCDNSGDNLLTSNNIFKYALNL